MCVYCKNSAGALLLLALAGCSDKDITTYRAPKEGAPTAAAPSAGPSGGPAGSLRWDAPPGWQAQSAGGLRLASFRAPGPDGTTADVSVFTFAGAGGDPLANINRWRAQLRLPPVAAERLPAELTVVESPAGRLSVADIVGQPDGPKPASRILGAWLRQDDRVWFFKMLGPVAAVQSQRDAFLSLLHSVAPAAGEAAPTPQPMEPGARTANTNDLPPEHIVVAPTDAPGEASLVWTAPADWRPKAATAVRKGSYSVPRGGGEADLAITAFPGDVGGVAANVNRWRGQVGLDPLDESAIGTVTEPMNANGLHFIIVDIAPPSGADGQRILAALASWQGATWFFKLTGPGGLVEDEKSAFLAFLRTVRPR